MAAALDSETLGFDSDSAIEGVATESDWGIDGFGPGRGTLDGSSDIAGFLDFWKIGEMGSDGEVAVGGTIDRGRFTEDPTTDPVDLLSALECSGLG
jgi:hypothetical protein